MLLFDYLTLQQEDEAANNVRSLLAGREWGEQQTEFLGHFLTSAFQPVVSVQNDQLVTIGYEAFVRPKAGDQAIGVEDYFAAMDPDNQAHVDALCRHLHTSAFSAQSHDNALLFLNIETAALAQDPHELANLLTQLTLIAQRGLAKNRLVLEIDLVPELDPGIVYTFAQAVKQQGVNIALEGFDADGASLARVVHARPHIVKFNRSWLDGDLNDPSYAIMVRQMVGAVHALGAVAHQEHIETQPELAFACQCGFHYMQGYGLGMPAAELQRVTLDFNQISSGTGS